jgi:hypothetical protein
MSTMERSPFSLSGDVEPWDPSQVSGNLADRLAAARRLSGSEESVPETADVDAFDSDESSPIYEQLMAEQSVDSAEATAEVDSTPDTMITATSRVGRLLQRISDRIENGAERADRTSEVARDLSDTAKVKIRGIGRVAARVGVATGEFAAGSALYAANKGLELADRADAAVLNAVDNAKENVKATATKAADKTGEAIMNGFAKVESGMDKVGDKMISLKEGAKERLNARMNKARENRKARRERWAKRLNGAKESVSNGLDRSAELAMAARRKLEDGMDFVGDKMVSAKESATDTLERGRNSVHTTRAAGRAALDAFKQTQRTHAEQNRLY